jgi:hypothetical protein
MDWQVFLWAILTYGSVYGDALFYAAAGAILAAKLPPFANRGTQPAASRKWPKILKNRFENGRRTNAKVRTPAHDSPRARCSLHR